MQLEQILDYCFPYTKEDATCSIKKQKKTWQRERLRQMVEAYKNGDIVDFDALKITVDIKEIMKRFEN